MDQDELLRRLVGALERLGLEYLVTGSVATIVYGEPRLTIDIDVVVRLPQSRIEAFVAAFPEEEFYIERDLVRQAVSNRGQFNIVHPRSGLKVDVIVPAMDDFDRSRFSRARRLHPADYEASFASPEDVIVKKLQFFSQGGSDKHLRDIAGVLKVSGDEIDRGYVAEWADRLEVRLVWDAILERLEGS